MAVVRFVRVAMLVIAIIGLGWFALVQPASALQAGIALGDMFDRRPSERILFIGNSRTYQNDLPYMVRKMADSAGSATRYDIEVRGFGGASLEAHWKSAQTRKLMEQETWDRIIVQAESRAHGTETQRDSFFSYGRNLLRAAKSRHTPSLVVNWTYGDVLYEGSPAETRQDYFAKIQADHRRLAAESHADIINVGVIWEDILAAHPPFPLYTDGNHASLHGSYAAALVIYAALSGTDGSNVTYVPSGMSVPDAIQIRTLVSTAVHSRIL